MHKNRYAYRYAFRLYKQTVTYTLLIALIVLTLLIRPHSHHSKGGLQYYLNFLNLLYSTRLLTMSICMSNSYLI
jgi:hypothetical protein